MRSIDFAPAQAYFIYLFFLAGGGRGGRGVKKNNGCSSLHYSLSTIIVISLVQPLKNV